MWSDYKTKMDSRRKALLFVRRTIHDPYVVESGSQEYRRNRRQILKVDEPSESVEMEQPEVEQEMQQSPREETRERIEKQSVQKTQDKTNDKYEQTELSIRKTRSGRIVKPPNKLNL